jgi:FkbM family methyltransferase
LAFKPASRADYVSICIGSYYEWNYIRWFASRLSDDEVFYDVGANIGVWAMPLSVRAREVHAFEPDDRSADALAENIALNALGNIYVHRAALGNFSERRVLLVRADGELSSFFAKTMGSDDNTSAEQVEVACFRLDDYVHRSGISPPTALKIDAEGAELLILDGLGDLTRFIRVIYVELHPVVLKSEGVADPEMALKQKLAELGFGVQQQVSSVHYIAYKD